MEGDEAADLVERIVTGLAAAATPERAEQEKRYLKSDLVHWGTAVPAARSVVRAALPRRPAPSHDLVVDVATRLWDDPADAPVHERRLAACLLLERHVAALDRDDLPLLERFLREARTWALVDSLAPNVVGPIVAADPDAADVLDRWCADEDLWLRRASVLALLRPLRAGGGDWEHFGVLADRLWADKEFFVRKALGWVLRDTARSRPAMVCAWLVPRAATASGVTLREAIKPLDADQRSAVEAARGR